MVSRGNLRNISYIDMFCLKFGSVVLLALIVSPFSVICFDLKACLKFHKVYPEVITTIPKQKVVVSKQFYYKFLFL